MGTPEDVAAEKHFTPPEAKPNSRLLAEISDILHRHYYPTMHESIVQEIIANIAAIKDAEWRQILRDTITMKDFECQARVEKIFKRIEQTSHPMNTNMIGISLSKDQWQDIKKWEGN